MRPRSVSFGDRAQLILLRWLSFALALVDSLFNVQWGERTLNRLSRRWQAQLDQVNESLARLAEERRTLQRQLEVVAIQTAAIHLGGRSLSRHELLFDPADPQDEKVLDASIDLLVKEKLAAIEPYEIAPGHYVYHLEPDWGAIRARLSSAVATATPEIAAWLHEGIQFIDEAFL